MATHDWKDLRQAKLSPDRIEKNDAEIKEMLQLGVLKVDASFDRLTSKAGVGGRMELENHGFFSFSSRLPAKTSGEAELLAIVEGLTACLAKKLTVNRICTDDKWCVDVVSGKIPRGHIDGKTFDLVDQIQNLLKEAKAVLSWIPREENVVADQLARRW